MDDETCLAFLEADGRLPTESSDRSGVPPQDDDTRAHDPELAWLAGQISRCTCSCCHRSSLGGCGAHRYDIEWSPVWIDSASSWSLRVLSGDVESENQFLPIEDLDRVREIVDTERQRRADLAP